MVSLGVSSAYDQDVSLIAISNNSPLLGFPTILPINRSKHFSLSDYLHNQFFYAGVF